MAGTEIAALSSMILQIASSIQNTGNNWYRASADWSDFPRKVEHLRRKHDFWLAKLTEYGLLSDNSLMETLRVAMVSLREEQARLSKKQSRNGAKWLSKVSMTVFPAKIGLRIQRVIDQFDAIMDQLELEQKAELALESRALRRAPSLAIPTDDRYAPLTISEAMVYSALEDPFGPLVVLLHGFPGKGKSTLARQTALHYNDTAKSDRFARVVFLECGREADRETKQLDLLQKLGLNAPQEQYGGESSSAMTTRRRLFNFLKHQKLLIILDDVGEVEFLRRMVDLCGASVRCLVTSQRADLCQGCSFSATAIQIEDAHNEAAMEILASHVGFRNKQIPPHIQELAKKIIEKTQGHPLALATIATEIDPSRSGDLEEWASVYENLLHALRSKGDTASVLGYNYPRSLWATMKLAVQSLGQTAQMLLMLVQMCAGLSVPEEVLQGLFSRAILEDSVQTFKRARKELEARDLIKITGLDNQRCWSIVHSLLKLFLDEEMTDWKESMFTILVPDIFVEFDDDAMTQTAICALYFDKQFSDRAASNLGMPSDRLNDLTRYAIEPITRLLGRPVSERWTAASEAAAKLVFWTYIFTCSLHIDGILQLLASPISIVPVMTALINIATVKEARLLDTNSQGFIKALVDVVKTSDASIARAAARAILQLSLNRLHVEVITSSGILDEIAKIIFSGPDPDVAEILSNIIEQLL